MLMRKCVVNGTDSGSSAAAKKTMMPHPGLLPLHCALKADASDLFSAMPKMLLPPKLESAGKSTSGRTVSAVIRRAAFHGNVQTHRLDLGAKRAQPC
jgi:hypothetical protein